jgi:hypothetical protein
MGLYTEMGDRGGCQGERAKMQISDIATVILLLHVNATTKRVTAECRWYGFPFVVNGVREDIGSAGSYHQDRHCAVLHISTRRLAHLRYWAIRLGKSTHTVLQSPMDSTSVRTRVLTALQSLWARRPYGLPRLGTTFALALQDYANPRDFENHRSKASK